MNESNKPDSQSSTFLDPSMARPRLKEGLVPPETGIYLRIETGKEPGKTYTLSPGGVYLIGRDETDIVLDDAKVSRKHAEIGLYGEGAFILRDLASTNGTFINGKRVSERATLSNWDLIRIGDVKLRFAVIEDSVPLSR